MEIFPSGSLKDRVIEHILSRPTSQIKVTAIAANLRSGKGHISEIVGFLKEAGIVKNNRADLSNPYVRSLKLAVNMNRIVKSGIIGRLKKSGIVRAGIYGSWARGSNNEESDLDMWIIPSNDMKALEIAGLSAAVGKALNANPEILILNKDKLAGMRKSNEVFYFSLVFGSVILIGEEIERLG